MLSAGSMGNAVRGTHGRVGAVVCDRVSIESIPRPFQTHAAVTTTQPLPRPVQPPHSQGTTPTLTNAQHISHTAAAEGLAACVQSSAMVLKVRPAAQALTVGRLIITTLEEETVLNFPARCAKVRAGLLARVSVPLCACCC